MDDTEKTKAQLIQELRTLRQQLAHQETRETEHTGEMQTLEDALLYAENIVETIREPLLVLQPDLRVKSTNQSFYQSFHVRPEETIGNLVYQLGNGQWDISRLRELLERVLSHNNYFNDFEVTHDFEDIGHRTMLLNARRIDSVQLILLAIEDITERKEAQDKWHEAQNTLESRVQERTAKLVRANEALHREIGKRQQVEEALRESEERYRSLIELSPDAIVVHRKRQIVYSNAAGAEILGAATPAELIGKSIEDFIHPRSKVTVETRMRQLIEEGKKLPVSEQQWVRLDGSVFDAEVRRSSLTTYQGKRAIQSIIRDISERKVLEQRLIQSERLALLGELASGLAHEIKNPLNGLSHAATLLTDDAGKVIDTEQVALLAVIQREVERLDRVITNFLHFVHPRSPHFVSYNLNALCMEVLEALQSEKASKGKEIRQSFDPQLPLLWGDAEQIRLVLWNIILNAYQAMDEGGILMLSSAHRNNDVLLVIHDTGHGIPPEEMEKIFTPFYSRNWRKSGLGLAIARRFIEAHGGRITLESEEHRGTKCTITLPLHGEKLQ